MTAVSNHRSDPPVIDLWIVTADPQVLVGAEAVGGVVQAKHGANGWGWSSSPFHTVEEFRLGTKTGYSFRYPANIVAHTNTPALVPEAAQAAQGGAESLLRELGAGVVRDSKFWFPALAARGHDVLVNHFVLGVGGEAGEILDVIKKADVCGGLMPTCENHADGKHSYAALEAEITDEFTYLIGLAHLVGVDPLRAYLKKRSTNMERWGDPDDTTV